MNTREELMRELLKEIRIATPEAIQEALEYLKMRKAEREQ